jgi:hypothetical protein
VISVYDHLFPQNVMFPLTTGLYNGIHFLVIGGVFLDSIESVSLWYAIDACVE